MFGGVSEEFRRRWGIEGGRSGEFGRSWGGVGHSGGSDGGVRGEGPRRRTDSGGDAREYAVS